MKTDISSDYIIRLGIVILKAAIWYDKEMFVIFSLYTVLVASYAKPVYDQNKNLRFCLGVQAL